MLLDTSPHDTVLSYYSVYFTYWMIRGLFRSQGLQVLADGTCNYKVFQNWKTDTSSNQTTLHSITHPVKRARGIQHLLAITTCTTRVCKQDKLQVVIVVKACLHLPTPSPSP